MSTQTKARVRLPAFEARLSAAGRALWARAAAHDHDGADPASLCAPLADAGLFVDTLPAAEGGDGLATDADAAPRLLHALMAVGAGDLSAGRLFEGHVNAVKLVHRYGGAAQQRSLAADVRAGAVGGVWNAEAPPGLTLSAAPAPGRPGVLSGGKIYCSGLGLVTRPLVTARPPEGPPLLLLLRLDAPPRHDLSGWTVRGMRATATGAVDLNGVEVGPEAVIGAPGDYLRAPLFKGGAWRFAAVQAGGVARVASLLRDALRARGGRDADPHQRTRLAAAAQAAETAELWVRRAAELVEGDAVKPEAADAYANLARLAVERAALEAIAAAERAVGLAAFTRPGALERVVRDLSTYLRQPFPDAACEDAAAFVSAGPPAPPWSVLADLPA